MAVTDSSCKSLAMYLTVCIYVVMCNGAGGWGRVCFKCMCWWVCHRNGATCLLNLVFFKLCVPLVDTLHHLGHIFGVYKSVLTLCVLNYTQIYCYQRHIKTCVKSCVEHMTLKEKEEHIRLPDGRRDLRDLGPYSLKFLF